MSAESSSQLAALAERRELGRYELLAPVARGGMATVWAGRLLGTHGFAKLVAIKTMLPGMSDDASFEKMFLDEATLASKLRNPHVVQILDLGEDDGVLYTVMEWVEGEPLNSIMRAATSRPPLEVVGSIIMQACAGLHAAHELKDDDGEPLALVHRDVSPHNLLVGFDGIAKVADFGIAKAMARGGSATEVGQIKGKTSYMAPEQAVGGALDRRCDIFALGIVLYHLTTGRHPFRGETDAETLANIVLPDPVTAPSKVVRGYPSELEAVVLRALAKDVDERFKTALDLMEALDAVMPAAARGARGYERVGAYVESLFGARRAERKAQLEEAIQKRDAAPTLPPPPETVPEPPRRRGALIAGGVTSAALAIGLVWSVSGSSDQDERQAQPSGSAGSPVVASASGVSSLPAGEMDAAVEDEDGEDEDAEMDVGDARAGEHEAATSSTPRVRSAGASVSPATASPRPTATSAPSRPAPPPKKISPVRNPGF